MVSKICERCKGEFNAKLTKTKFCSQQCYMESRKNKKICPICWTIFEAKNNAAYCSRKCYFQSKWWDLCKNIPCIICWKHFKQKSSKQRCCCIECSNKWKRQIPDKACPTCWKIFRPVHMSNKFCSRECAFESRRTLKKIICPSCWEEFKQTYSWQIYCCKRCSQSHPSNMSKDNKRFWKLLTQLKFKRTNEFQLWWYFYDFKIWNILIELNPYAFHNSTFAPISSAKPKDKLYHYNKCKYAVKNWYKCIMVWDWTDNLIDMITDSQFHYEWLPQLHYYNPKTKEHIIRRNRNKSRIDKWFVEIRDCGKETF